MRERDWGEGGVTLRISHTRNRSARDDWRRLAVTWGSFEGRGPSTPVRAKAARACAQDDRLKVHAVFDAEDRRSLGSARDDKIGAADWEANLGGQSTNSSLGRDDTKGESA
jgi:hypothetical protein